MDLRKQRQDKLLRLRMWSRRSSRRHPTDLCSDNANFINFCTGKTVTNGQQVKAGSCNGIGTISPLIPVFWARVRITNHTSVMGDIPSTNNMISAIITNPGPGTIIPPNQDFNITVRVSNLVAGSFTNPDVTYYAAPQALKAGNIVGHTHVTVQSLGTDIATTIPPDPAKFAFFKGINDSGDGKGALSAAVKGGLPAGVYRVCTMTSASNHQPVLMPVSLIDCDDVAPFTLFLTDESGV